MGVVKMNDANIPFLRRVILRNYKSIRECDVSLGPLMFLVGPNGSGKSNFLEAIRFVPDSLRNTVKHAVEERSEVRDIYWRGQDGSRQFSIQLFLNLPDGGDASYAITVGDHEGLFVIEQEDCRVCSEGTCQAAYEVRRGEVESATIPNPPPSSDHQLYLTTVAGFPGFGDLYELLRGMRFFNIDPEQIRAEATSGKPAHELMRNGQGALFATHRSFHNDRVRTRIQEYLRAILPALDEVKIETTKTSIGQLHGTPIRRGEEDELAGEPRSIQFRFRQDIGHANFRAWSMSDGTLHAFGVLLALFQCVDRPAKDPIPLVGIEEPESTLHPAATGVLFDALHEASHFTQVLVTTHSAELLDIKDVDPESLLIVEMVKGETVIGPADEASMSAMRDRMYTAGELLEMNQLRPHPQQAEKASTGQSDG